MGEVNERREMSALNETRHTHLRFVGFVHSVSFTSFHSLLLNKIIREIHERREWSNVHNNNQGNL